MRQKQKQLVSTNSAENKMKTQQLNKILTLPQMQEPELEAYYFLTEEKEVLAMLP